MLQLSLLLLAATQFLSAQGSCLHGTSLLRREVNNGQVKVATFGYEEEAGPLLWSFMNENNTACGLGHDQSPINLNGSVAGSPPVNVSVPWVREAVFENLGSTLEVTNVTGTTIFNNTQFDLRQFHFHTPSEHHLNGEHYPMEMHMLSEDGSTADFLTAVTENIEDVEKPGSIAPTGALDLSEIATAFECQDKFHYVGSLTTPPCTEGINFVVLKEPFSLNVKTYNAMKKIMKFNSRYTQNAPGRENLLELVFAQLGECIMLLICDADW
ncbi:hypothetical protein AAF712_009888 [Marasmius tenuissimus]|uniref:Carbonic anhydrase n=1 Tax=Marasmius tenuissimus TaxID=585030 RepID=A0ABR2ZPF7_9AGAR